MITHPFLAHEDLISLVDHLLKHAKEEGASDIHLEPYEKSCRLRYRQDGLLYEIAELPLALASRIITRLKIMANLDITERRLPQDGRLKINHTSKPLLEIRISSCPTLHGEKLALRLLDSSTFSLPIEALGFSPEQEKLFRSKLSKPQGLILVTGPTGSGKTVSLYSALQALNTPQKNILTVEDPIEIPLAGINQVQVNPKIGLDYARTLRAFLRQDPDIIMIGEIRDRETAEIALQAAQTGHLVFATLHTNNALEAVARLNSLGSQAYPLAPALSLIIAQRLFRKLCSYCKTPDKQRQQLFHAKGCSRCLQGYSGRMALFECLNMSERLSNLVLNQADPSSLLKVALKEGFQTLWARGQELIKEGHTDLIELERVLQA